MRRSRCLLVGTEPSYFKRSRQYPGLRLEHSNASTVACASMSAIKIAYA